MSELITLTINGQAVQAEKNALLIDVAKRAGINIPAFCYYEGLSLQAACRMCLVEVEKAPKLLAACTLPVAEGMVVKTESETVVNARKFTLEFLLTNHPLDCPVCDKGGECELQDMVFRYGAGESRYTEIKHHVEEKQWSPVVFYDAPRCILCYRCVRICDEGMGVKALGVTNRGAYSEITPNLGDHLACDECGACIDICPVGALTSGTYRYQTRPWEMDHVGTICTHCGDGCKTTLGVKNNEILRGNNRDSSGINGEFLCIKGRYGFDFVHHSERLQSPMMRVNGKLEEVSWATALGEVARRFAEVKMSGGKFGVIGSNHTTNEENFYLQKFAKQGLGTPHVDHHRTGDVSTLIDALSGTDQKLATTDDLYNTKAALVIGADLAQQHPFLAFQLRANWRHHQSHTYVVTSGPVREDSYATQSLRAAPLTELNAVESLAETLKAEKELVIVFGDCIQGEGIRRLVKFADTLGIPVSYVCLLDYSNSRGAVDMGLTPDAGGLTTPEMLDSTDMSALWVVGANPLKNAALGSPNAFLVVQDLFMTETAQRANIVLPAASAYEKHGTVTNVCGQVQRLAKGPEVMGAKADLQIFGLLARGMRLDIGQPNHEKIFDEIKASIHGYNSVPMPVLVTGGAATTAPVNGRVPFAARGAASQSAGDTLYTSGTLGRYSKMLTSVPEAPGKLYR
jgi:NADH-quinone oxidoreductase subunit G